MGIVAGPLSAKQVEAKQKGGIETRVPRSAFTFEAPKPPGGQGNPMRPTYVSRELPGYYFAGHGTGC